MDTDCTHKDIFAEYRKINIENAPAGSVGSALSTQSFVVVRCAACNAVLRVLAWKEITG